jgi:hypothetical protein
MDGRVRATAKHSYSYPITVDSSAANYVDDQNFQLTGSVEMTQTLSDETGDGRHWSPAACSTEWLSVCSAGLQMSRCAGLSVLPDVAACGSSEPSVVLRVLLVGGLEHRPGGVDLFGQGLVELCCVLLDDGPDDVVVDRPVVVGDSVTHAF